MTRLLPSARVVAPSASVLANNKPAREGTSVAPAPSDSPGVRAIAMSPITPIPKRGAKNALSKFAERTMTWDPLSIFNPRPPLHLPRSVLINVPLPAHALMTAPKVPIPGFSKERETILPDGTIQMAKVAKGYGEKTVASKGWIFESNQVLTSKYNIFTFVPRNALEQVSHSPPPPRPRRTAKAPSSVWPLLSSSRGVTSAAP